MKLLGDDCWWAPRWMRRLQNRIGLGEIHLPDERKRPALREPQEALSGAGSPALPPARRLRDPTHPAVEAANRPGATRPGPRAIPPRQPQAPSGAGTTRMPGAGQSDEPTTTRLSVAAKNAAKAVITNATGIAQRAQKPAPRQPAPREDPAPRQNREIESWLGELRGTAAGPPAPAERPAPQPSTESTRAMPEAPARAADDDAEETTAIPKAKPDPEATEKLPKPGGDERRRGGGVSAQDLLRREGRRL